MTDDALDQAITDETFAGTFDSANDEIFAPRGLVAKAGSCVMITRQLPPMEHGLDEELRVGRIFYAEHQANADAEGFRPDGRYKVICRSPFGDVHLWPYEYAVMDALTLVELWQETELVFHPTDMEAGRLNEVVFYLRSRGIGVADAMAMALGTLTGPVGWFEPREDLAADIEAMERRVHTPLAQYVSRGPRAHGEAH